MLTFRGCMRILSLALIIVFSSPFLSPDVEVGAEEVRSSKKSFFVVSSDEISSADSLNRIAGNASSGFASKEQTYQSESHNARRTPFESRTVDRASQAE